VNRSEFFFADKVGKLVGLRSFWIIRNFAVIIYDLLSPWFLKKIRFFFVPREIIFCAGMAAP
jgi:hypothetical protein